MGIYTVTMKKHSEENLTSQFANLNPCLIHGCTPQIWKIVSGKRKEIDFIAECKEDGCGKIKDTAQGVVDCWNKWNPKSE